MKRVQLRLVEGDITELVVDAIVNPANSHGVMGGGVAGAIRKKGGVQIEKEAVSNAPILIGQAVLTGAGALRTKHIIHAPTMTEPAEITNTKKVKQAMKAALECADRAGLNSIAIPGMGTGVGRVKPNEAAQAMVETVQLFEPKTLKAVIFVSWDKELKKAFEQALK